MRKTSSRWVWLTVAGCGLLSLTAAVLADMANVYLKNGLTLRGDVTETEAEVIVRNAAGEVRYKKSDVARIEYVRGEQAAETQPTETLVISVEAEYLRRFQALDPKDLESHFKLAEWLREQKRFDLTIKQCNYILGLQPDHRNAKLLLQLARQDLAQQAAEKEARDEEQPVDEGPGRMAPPPLLSARDVQRLRMSELPLDGPAEKVRVRFLKKRGAQDLDDLVDRDLATLADAPDGLRERYRRAQPHEKLQIILENLGLKYADRIEILHDPAVFDTFRKRVLPLVYQSCGRSGCHGGSGATVFRLPARSPKDESIHASFVLLDQMWTQYGPLLNRDIPADSVLLGYMLPPEGNDQVHPQAGRQRVVPALRGLRDRNYEVILDWINSLTAPHPNYGLEYAFPEWMAALSRPATTQAAAGEGGPAGEKPKTQPVQPPSKDQPPPVEGEKPPQSKRP